MRVTPLAVAVMLAFCAGAPARSASGDIALKTSSRAVYLVEFVEPPLASFRGAETAALSHLAGLKATSPQVTGAPRLDAASPDSRAYLDRLGTLRAERLARFSGKLGRDVQPLFEYDVVLNGVAIELSAEEAGAMAKWEGVRSIEPDFLRRPMTDAGPRWIGADQLWTGAAGATTQGEGIVIGIVDSGINRAHPSFAQAGPLDGFAHVNPKGQLYGRCATPAQATECNNKLIGLYDFTTCTGNDSGCDDREANDASDRTSHGSHVASIAAGNALNATLNIGGSSITRRLSGVAPHANLIAYKVCEDEETCRGSWTLAGLNQAVADGVDVINYSIGGSPRNPWSSADANAMLSAREAGIVVVVAAGNDGPGAGTVTSPGDAPWVIAAANASHDRAVVNRLVDLSGGNTAPPQGGVLVGQGDTAGYGPAPLLIDPEFPGCSQGADLDSPPSGISNPWPAGRFNGQIVVCDRGVQARVAKSNNVRLAGGGGMVLVNTTLEGESTVADQHSIPATHLGVSAGSALKTWLASGSGHTGRIEGASIQNVPALADVLAASSGRGPVLLVPGLMKPDVTAPGTNILGAVQSGSQLGFLSGTSMASPHTAGAAALLRAARPQWTPSQIESALMTSALPVVRLQDGSTLAGPFEQGNGRIDVAKALNAGLSFNVTPAEFRSARPSQGGVPHNLNRASLLHEECFEQCSLTRRVTDMVGGASWQVVVDMPSPASVVVTPSSFTLAAGETREISFAFDVSDASLPGSWVNGRVRFERTAGNPATNASIPVAVFADPGPIPTGIALSGSAEAGFQDITFSALVALPHADFGATPLVAPQRSEESLAEDPSRDDRYDAFGIDVGTFFRLLTVPGVSPASGVFKLTADTRSATAFDVDLFVGEDFNGNGQPDESEELCSSTSQFAIEHCEIDIVQGAAPRTFWVLAQNWDAGAAGPGDPGVRDNVVLETVLIDVNASGDMNLVPTGPGKTTSGEEFKLRLAWNDPTLLPGDRRAGYLRLGTDPARPGQVGLIPIALTRNTQAEHAVQVLAPGVARRMMLQPQAAQDRLYIDVPPNASGLTVTSSGSGEVDIYLSKATTESSPGIDAAPPRSSAAASAATPGANETLTIGGAALAPGRWYVTPVNAGSSVADFSLTASLQFGSARPQPQFGAYFNPARAGAGLFLFPAGDLWGLAWYTYLQDGSPTWYLGVTTSPPTQQGVWNVALQRFSWDGSQARGTTVGNAQLALTSADRFTFSWNLDGQSGSEPMAWIDGGACAQLGGAPAALTGLWYSPSNSGFGYSINAYPGLESNGAYFYDAQGIARWALGQTIPFGGNNMTLSTRTGFCPLCSFAPPVQTEVGVLTRRYDSATAGQISVDIELRPPLKGLWSVDLPVARISDALTCP